MAIRRDAGQFRRSAIVDLIRTEGITASEFARRIGVSRQVVSEYRSGLKSPSLTTVAAMAEEFGKPIDFFIEHARRDDDKP